MDDNGRKDARYSSQNVLSGLLICGECDCNYRRITRSSGEAVWRCADRVENGKRANCANTMTVSDKAIKRAICEQLNIDFLDEDIVRDAVDAIVINEGVIEIQMKSSQMLGSMIL